MEEPRSHLKLLASHLGVAMICISAIGLFATPSLAGGECDPAATATKYPSLAGKTIRMGQSPTSHPMRSSSHRPKCTLALIRTWPAHSSAAWD